MEQIAELNHSLLSKLPLGLQSLLKSLPLSDFSFLLLIGTWLVVVFWLLSGFLSGSSEEAFDFGEYKRENKEVFVKPNTPISKKPQKRNKRKKENRTAEQPLDVQKEAKHEQFEETAEEGWEQVKVRKPKEKVNKVD